MTKKLAPMHPREVLREEFLVPLKLSASGLPWPDTRHCGQQYRRACRRDGISAGRLVSPAYGCGVAVALMAQTGEPARACLHFAVVRFKRPGTYDLSDQENDQKNTTSSIMFLCT